MSISSVCYKRPRLETTLSNNSNDFLNIDLLSLIVSDYLDIQSVKSFALTCKNWNKIVLSTALKSKMLSRFNLEHNEKETWLKTYNIWLNSRLYILLDCSYSIPTDESTKAKINQFILAKGSHPFDNGWLNGVHVGRFAGTFILDHFLSKDDFSLDVGKFKNDLLTPRGSYLHPILNAIFQENSNVSKRIAIHIHIISDFVLTAPEIIEFSIKNLLKFYTVSFDFQRIGNDQNANTMIERLKALKMDVQSL